MKSKLFLTTILSFATTMVMAQAAMTYMTDATRYTGSMFDEKTKDTDITIKAPALKGDTLLLGYHFLGQIYVKDSVVVDNKGKAKIHSNERFPEGLYTICVKRSPVVDLLLGGDQTMTVKLDTTNAYRNVTVEGSAESIEFNSYAQFMRELQDKSREIRNDTLAAQDTAKQARQNAELKLLTTSLTERQNGIVARRPGSMIALFIKGLQTVEFQKPKGYDEMSDSLKWVARYQFQKNHYWDNLDLSDERTLRTPYIKQSIDTYLNNVLVQRYDSIIPAAIEMIEKSRKGNEVTFRAICNYILQYSVKSNIMGLDRLLVELGHRYYLNGTATWADSTMVSNIGKEIKKIENSLVGDQAHNISLCGLDGKYRSIYEMSGTQYTVLFFFEPQCGHCKQTAPKVSEFYEKYKDDPRLKIIAVYMLTDENEWKKFIEEKNMQNMTNVWDPSRTSFYWHWFDTSSTPMIYVLDKDHKIFAKKIDAETLKLIADNELK